MRYDVYKQRYSERLAYRYSVVDEERRTCCLAEPVGFFLPNPTRLVMLLDADRTPVARLEPPLPSPWRRGGDYALFLKGEETPLVVITEQWTLVDFILLRLPRYVFRLDGVVYTARGHRYGERLYQIFSLPEQEEPEEPEEAELPLPESEEELQAAFSPEAIAPQDGGELVGEILRASRGPTYIIEVQSPPLAQASLVLTALMVLIDTHLDAHPF